MDMEPDESTGAVTAQGYGFVNFLWQLLKRRFPAATVLMDDIAGDILIADGDDFTIVVAKHPPPQTEVRAKSAAAELYAERERLTGSIYTHSVKLVLATPGTLSTRNFQVLSAAGIQLWDRTWLDAAAAASDMSREFTAVIGEPAPWSLSRAQQLERQMDMIPPGRQHWFEYQKFCGEVLEYLFCPPLSPPIVERTNETQTNRRDFIFPNYANDGFWAYLRTRYDADHIVVDAKNYNDGVKKIEVLQLGNYLSLHGPGRFGAIITWVGAKRSALVTRREQWIVYNKLILILDDQDVKQMLKAKASSDNPDLLIRQKIEDFRLSI